MVEKNSMMLTFKSISENVPFARTVVGSFAAQLNPTLEEIADIKTAVSEAVTNAVVHAYEDDDGDIRISCSLYQNSIEIEVSDYGKGIEDLKQARQPFYSSCDGEERSGMGFTLMEMFSDSLNVSTKKDEGTTVLIKKNIKNAVAATKHE